MAAGKVTLRPFVWSARPNLKWEVCWPNPEPGKARLKKRFATKAAAKTFKATKDVLILNDGRSVAGLPETWIRDASWARKQLAGTACTLRHVVEDYLQRHRIAQRSVVLREAANSYIDAREHAGLAPRSLGDMRVRLERFTDDMPEDCLVSGIEKRAVEDWIAGLKVAPQTQKNFQRVLHAFFEWGKGRGYCEGNPAALGRATTKRAKMAVRPVQIFTPSELRTILDNCPAEILAYHVIGAFCGIRSAELERMQWEDVDLVRGQVAISPEQSKTASRRFVELPAAAKEWLRPLAKETGPIAPPNAQGWLCREFHRTLAKDHKLVWKDNGLRHSFASYALALYEDAPRVSLWLGQATPRVIFQHYRERATKEDAALYFGTKPKAEAKNVVAFKKPSAPAKRTLRKARA